MKTLTITFASQTDMDDALRQITKARDYAARGGQLGVLGQALLLTTLVRAKSIETEDQKADPDFIYCVKSILRETDRKMNVRKDFNLMVAREGLKRGLEKLEPTTNKKV